MKRWIVLLAMLASANALAQDYWKFFAGAKIHGITQWQDNQPVYFRVTPDTYCWVPASEKNMIALIMSLHASGKTADIHCNPAVESVGGIPGHRLHRIGSN